MLREYFPPKKHTRSQLSERCSVDSRALAPLITGMHSRSDFPQLQRTFFDSVSDLLSSVVHTGRGSVRVKEIAEEGEGRYSESI